MTTNVWINNVMRDILSFLGVYSSDNIKEPKMFPSSCIVNFSPKDTTGTHFVVILYNTPNSCIYYDPMNLGYIPNDIFSYMKTCYGKNVETINFALQHPFSIYCGFYCLLTTMLHLNKIPILKCIQKNFVQYSFSNDENCISILCKLMHLYYLSY